MTFAADIGWNAPGLQWDLAYGAICTPDWRSWAVRRIYARVRAVGLAVPVRRWHLRGPLRII